MTGKNAAWAATAALLVLPLLSGCARRDQTLQVWRQAASVEHVSRYSPEISTAGGEQWFARVLRPERLPAGAAYNLAGPFDFLLVTRPSQWTQVLHATNLDDTVEMPDFDRGIVVGLIARVGETPRSAWPITIASVRQRGSLAFLYGEFHEGFYRPLTVPPYLHLIYLPGVKTILGVKINQLICGFNVEVDELRAVGIP